MVPIIFLIGKFNVGKSNFFNKINYFEDNLSFDFNSLTLNNKNTFNILKNFNYLVIDTIGFNFFLNFNFNLNIFIYDSDIILFFFDNYLGIFYEDKILSNFLKKLKKYVFLIINKVDFLNFNINIFYFFKLGFKKPYLVSSSNNFNTLYLLYSVLNIFCFLKKCFYLIKKKNKFKILILNTSNFESKLFINFFFTKKIFLFDNRDIFYYNFKFNNLKFSFFNILNFTNKEFFKKKIKKISFLNFFKIIIISDLIFFIINPFENLKNIFLFKFILKYFKSLMFFVNCNIFLSLNLRIYFKNFFKKKFFLYFFYIFFIFIFKKINFFYILYYIDKIFNLIYINLKINKLNLFFLNFNNFLFFNKKLLKIKILYAHQGGKNPPLIIIHGINLNRIDNNDFKFLKNSLMNFLKIKSIYLNITLI